MISVEFRKVGPGNCRWCKKDKEEVFSVIFSDKSFAGDYCKNDLLRAIRDKCEVVEGERKPLSAAVPVGNGSLK
jgi:hypothetical protein